MAAQNYQLSPVNSTSTLADKVYITVKGAILTLKLKPGSPLVEDELARQLGTSKTPVRDALLALERDGFVVKIPYRGTYVAEVSIRDAKEIFELRAVLEGLAARLAAGQLTPAELDGAEKLLDASEAALQRGDLDEVSHYGAKFHRAIFARADNRRLLPILDNLDHQLQRLRMMSAHQKGRLQKSAVEHRRILVALRSGDAAGAEQAMRDHLSSVLADYLANAESGNGVSPED